MNLMPSMQVLEADNIPALLAQGDLTRSGVLGHYRIGKSIRYDLAEVEATLRARFHVGGAALADAGQGSSEPSTTQA